MADSSKYYEFIKGACKAFDITTEKRLAAFFSQIAHESAGLSRINENLNYSAEALNRVWPKHFPTIEFATDYARKPERIANRAYANRMGNGDESTGEGWLYRGRGLIQLTGKNNVRAVSEYFGEDFLSNPDKLEEPMWCALVAGWYWNTNKLNSLADAGDNLSITKRINGGTHGLADRMDRYQKALDALKGFDATYLSFYK